MLTWKNDSLISARAKGKKNKYRLIYQVEEKVANATLEVYQDGCNMVKVFGKDFDWLKSVANEMESWQ